MGWVVNATSRPFNPREWPGTLCIGGWVGSRAGLEKYHLHRNSIPGLSLYRLSYPGEIPSREVEVWLYLFLVSTLDGDEGSLCFNPKKEQWCPLNWRLSGLQSRSGRFGERKISCPFRDSSSGPSNLHLCNFTD